MYLSVFSDELFMDVYKAIPIIKSWGCDWIDLRNSVNGKGIEFQSVEELLELKRVLDQNGLKVGVIQSSLCKVHLPDKERQQEEYRKAEGIVRAAKILDCRLVRSFNFWQPEEVKEEPGALAVRPDVMGKVMMMFAPIAKLMKDNGLILGFENCGQTPEEVIAMLGQLDVPGWGIAWDVFNSFVYSPEKDQDFIEYCRLCLPYSNMVHVKAASIVPEVVTNPIPWERVLKGIAAIGKDIPVSIETHNPKSSPMTHEEATFRSFKGVKRLWPNAAPSSLDKALASSGQFERGYASDPVKFVVVGLGMGKYRAQQLTETNGTKLVGVCDLDITLAKEAGEQFNVPYSNKIEDFLNNPEVEVMYVVTPTGLHADVGLKCLEAGKHLLTTKPMDVTPEACQRMIDFAREKNLCLGVDFDIRHETSYLELKKAVAENWFGKILAVNSTLYVRRTQEYYDEKGGWRGTWRYDGGGSMMNQGIHEVDRLVSVFGMPKRVRAVAAIQTHDIETEDIASAVWDYGDGRIVRIFTTTSYPIPSWNQRLEIHGTDRAYISMSGGPEGTHAYWSNPDGSWIEQPPYPLKRLFRQGSDNFANTVRTGESLSICGEEGMLSCKVMKAAYESAKNDFAWIEV